MIVGSGSVRGLPMARKTAATTFCHRLKEARGRSGMSQKKLGEAIGLDPGVASTRINRYELGVHQPDLDTSARLAKVLGVPLAYLYAQDDRLAQMILAFSKLSKADQEQLIKKMG